VLEVDTVASVHVEEAKAKAVVDDDTDDPDESTGLLYEQVSIF